MAVQIRYTLLFKDLATHVLHRGDRAPQCVIRPDRQADSHIAKDLSWSLGISCRNDDERTLVRPVFHEGSNLDSGVLLAVYE